MVTKIIYSIIVALLLVATACNNQNRGEFVLNDPQRQDAVLDSIAANPTLLQKLHEKANAKGNATSMNDINNMGGMNMGDSSMMGMMNNPRMMNQMMNMMMEQCIKDTAMCRRMCNKMMDNPKMMEMMRSLMKSKGADTTK